MKTPIRVLIADDHEIVRKGSTVLLATEKAGSLEPEVVLMDLVMPRSDGIEATRRSCWKRSTGCIGGSPPWNRP